MKRVLFFVLVLLVSWVTVSFAQSTNPGSVPNQFSYQGQLQNSAGEPVADGIYTIVFTLYDEGAGGIVIWTETQNVNVQQGVFSVVLGSVTAIDITKINDTSITLGIKVGSDSEMTPRQLIFPMIFSLKSKNSDDSKKLQGKQPADFAANIHNHNASEINTTGATNLVSKIIAGSGISISPTVGTGDVTISVISAGGGVQLQTTTPGTQQTGSINVSGDIIAGALKTSTINGLININADSSTADTVVNITNNDTTYKANLNVEGGIQTSSIGAININNNATVANIIGTAAKTTFYGNGNNLTGVLKPGANIIGSNEIIDGSIAISDIDLTSLQGTIQKKLTGNCSGQVAVGIDTNGAFICEPDDTGGGGGGYVNLTPTVSQVIQGTGDFTSLTIKAQAGQTTPIFTVVDASDIKKFAVMSDGHIFIPGNNILHLLNIDNDSPTGPMGNININVMNNIANSKLNILNPDATYTAGLTVEGNVLVGNPAQTTPMLSIKQNGTDIGLAVETSLATTSTALDVWQKGTGSGIVTSVDGGSSPAIEASHSGTGSLLQLYNSGGIQVEVSNAGNLLVGNPTIKNAKVSVEETGTANAVGRFEITNAANSFSPVYGKTNGSGASVYGNNIGTGWAGRFEINNATNTSTAVYGMTAGTGRAGWFWVNNASNASEAINAQTDGTGFAGWFKINNVSNASAVLSGNTTGTGNLLQLQQSGTNKFVVTNTGDLIFGPANPTIRATGVSANIILDANDAGVSNVTITNSGTGQASLAVEGDIGKNVAGTFNIKTTNGGITLNANSGAGNTTVQIQNTDVTNKANLQVEGNILAFNGSNAVTVSGSNVQQLIQTGNTCEATANAGSIVVAFTTAFAVAPIVTIGQTGGTTAPVGIITAKTISGFTITPLEASVSNECFDWIAIGTK